MTNSILEIELFLSSLSAHYHQPAMDPIALLRKCACWSLQNSNITLNGLPTKQGKESTKKFDLS
jgi:hypothetical protein